MASKSPLLVLALSFSLLLVHLPFRYGQGEVKGGYWLDTNGINPLSDIDSTLYTHLFCAFANLDPSTNQLSLPSGCTTFASTVRQKNPSAKVLLSIGGGTATATSAFSSMASQPSSRQTFINSSIFLARSNRYDGLDLDWENQPTESDMNNMGTLLDEWRTAINAESSSSGAQTLILTAAVGYSPHSNGPSFPVQAMSKNLDWANVMAYDFYTPARSPGDLTRSHAALDDPDPNGPSGRRGIGLWINANMPVNKLVLGIPFYGYAWELKDPNNHGILAPEGGWDDSVSNGVPTYRDIKGFMSQKGATMAFNETYKTNYCYSGTTWIGYDDERSVAAKASYAKNNGLLGYFAWSLNQDDASILSNQAFQGWASA